MKRKFELLVEGGDRNTISAMTGAIAGACYGIEKFQPNGKINLKTKLNLKFKNSNWRKQIKL